MRLLCITATLLTPPLLAADIGSWDTAADMPSSRQEVGVGLLDGKIYVIGGFESGVSVNTVERYDPIQNMWEPVAPLPATEELNHVGVAVVSDELFVIGGLTQSFSPVPWVFAYNASAEMWTQRADLPAARGGTGVAVIDNLIYAAGGQPFARFQDFAVYDPVSNDWTPLPDLPTGRNHLCAATVDGRFYAISGRQGSTNVDTVEMYDPSTNMWTPREPIPTARSGLACAVINDLVYVFGGEGNNANPDGTFNENEEYDPVADDWRAVAPMPEGRHGIGAAVFDGKIYIPGGGPEEGLSDTTRVDVFTPPAPTPASVSALFYQ